MLYFDRDRVVDPERLRRMRDRLIHRGPDFGNSYIDGNIGLGHRRLSIIDLSAQGNQPMYSADKRYIIVYNGEIYNFRELKVELLNHGYSFHSSCDTEILVNLYITYGSSMLDKLNGMFSFAIWDTKERVLFAARDRVGIKPFFYLLDNEQFLFSSEPKAIFSYGYPLALEYDNLNELLLYRFTAGENTVFKDIKRLLPGHSITVESSGKTKINRWWKLADKIAGHEKIKDPLGWFKATLDSSIKNHLISDVPVGVLLSGGLDSSSICASLFKQQINGIQTFNVGFSNVEDDESALARQVSKSYDFPFHSINVEDEDLEENLELSNFINDEPPVHQNEAQIVAISRYAKKYITVILSGEGADEFLGGYVRYKPIKYLSYSKGVKRFLKFLPDGLKTNRVIKLERYFSLPTTDLMLMMNSVNNFPEEFDQIGMHLGEIHNDYRKKILQEAREVYPGSLQRQALYFDQHTYLSSLNDRNDRSTMAASLECRVPFLDHRLMEGLGTLEDKYLFKGRKGKYILKKAYEDILPPSILSHEKKGFSVPWMRFIFKNENLREFWNTMEKSDIFHNSLFNGIDIVKLKEKAGKGDISTQMLLRQFFFTSLWWKQYQDRFKYVLVITINVFYKFLESQVL